MLGFGAIGQYALGEPGGDTTVVTTTIALNAYGCLCVTVTVYPGPPLAPTSNVVRTGPGIRDNVVI